METDKTLQRPYFALYAQTIIENGYSVVAVRPSSKRPSLKRWQTASFKPSIPAWVEHYARSRPSDSIGIGCGRNVVGIDIDILDAGKAHDIQEAAVAEFGATDLIRVGRWPKRILLYATDDAIDTARLGSVEILGRGSQFVAFGVHPEIHRPYYWVDASPTDTDAADLPLVRRDGLARFLLLVSEIIGVNTRLDTPPANDNATILVRPTNRSHRIVRNSEGIVTDGREELMRALTWEEFHKGYQSPDELARRVWSRFAIGADIQRPKEGGRRRWSLRDALTKAKQICRKQPLLRPRRQPAGFMDHLNSYRRSEYWNVDRKAQHQNEATQRAMTPAALIVNRKMLDAVSFSAGQCSNPVSVLIKQTKLSESSVKSARRTLCQAGLWIAERGVYVPIPVSDHTERADSGSAGVQMERDPLYRSVGPSAPGSNPADPSSVSRLLQRVQRCSDYEAA